MNANGDTVYFNSLQIKCIKIEAHHVTDKVDQIYEVEIEFVNDDVPLLILMHEHYLDELEQQL